MLVVLLYAACNLHNILRKMLSVAVRADDAIGYALLLKIVKASLKRMAFAFVDAMGNDGAAQLSYGAEQLSVSSSASVIHYDDRERADRP